MTKYNTAITIEKKIDDDVFMVYGFTGYFESDRAAYDKAWEWIKDHTALAERKNMSVEIEKMEFEPKEYSWV